MISLSTNIRAELRRRKEQRGFLLNPYRFGGAAAGGNVVLLLHMDGADGSTTFTDSSPSPKTVSPFGNAQIDTAQSKFGGASALFDGTGDYLSVPHETALDFQSGDFTIEMWLRFASLATTQNIIGKRSGVDYGPFSIIYNSSTSRIESRFDQTIANSVWDVDLGGTQTIVTNTWYHYAATRQGTSFRHFIDGALIASGTLSGTLVSSTAAVFIGANSTGANAFNGWIDELRINKGFAYYTAGFTPPSAPF